MQPISIMLHADTREALIAAQDAERAAGRDPRELHDRAMAAGLARIAQVTTPASLRTRLPGARRVDKKTRKPRPAK